MVGKTVLSVLILLMLGASASAWAADHDADEKARVKADDNFGATVAAIELADTVTKSIQEGRYAVPGMAFRAVLVQADELRKTLVERYHSRMRSDDLREWACGDRGLGHFRELARKARAAVSASELKKSSLIEMFSDRLDATALTMQLYCSGLFDARTASVPTIYDAFEAAVSAEVTAARAMTEIRIASLEPSKTAGDAGAKSVPSSIVSVPGEKPYELGTREVR